MTLLSVEGLFVRRGPASVLRDISFDVAEGEVVSLLGSNGVGKSTTLRTISGLHKPYAGEIRLGGKRLDGLSPKQVVRAGVAHVPEGRQVFPTLTVRENLAMGCYRRGRLRHSDVERTVELFPALGSLLNRRAGALSGGQQQMLAIARGLLAEPRLLLLDEPSLGLAPVVIQSIARILRDLKEQRMTILLVEQNAALALDVADRGYVISDGSVILSGTSAELGENPRVRAAYLGI
jgi:branched-chain amino acid transport system ATP-binding protein